jgi:hypothetical protein
MTKQKAPKEKVDPVNLKEQNARHTFTLTFRDLPHFYRVINWMNSQVGKGEDKWTVKGRVKKVLVQQKTVTTKVYVFIDGFDPSNALFLSLI